MFFLTCFLFPSFIQTEGLYINAVKPFFFLIFLAFASVAWAHPHVFADVTVQAVFDESGLKGVQNHWEYDEIYGTSMYAAADANDDGVLSDAELESLKKAVLEPLAGQNYYNYVLNGTKFLKATGVENFQAKKKNGKLILDYLVRFSIPVTKDYQFFVVVVADPTYYIAVTADMENSGAQAPDAMEVEYYDDNLDGLTLMKSFRSEVEGLYVRFKK